MCSHMCVADADTEQRLLELIGFCSKYFAGIQWQTVTLVDLISSPWHLAYFISFQLKRNTGAATMIHSFQACCKVIVWALHRVCTLSASCSVALGVIAAGFHTAAVTYRSVVQVPLSPEQAANLRAIRTWYFSLMEDAKHARPKRRRTDPVVLAAQKQWLDGETMLQLSFNFLMEGEPLAPSFTLSPDLHQCLLLTVLMLS